uniref:Uncharacterized protein n=1 Tax=Alexandrium catenella TaxID=2925 RepID=A0A7S1WVU9_ALECA|mmetsp:Transcript_93737/g.248851  ORF Transcript_93737/g.248851 Transcript_93737/m.248851 type:complete len:668 (+) Transcript_93737:2-2005(+)
MDQLALAAFLANFSGSIVGMVLAVLFIVHSRYAVDCLTVRGHRYIVLAAAHLLSDAVLTATEGLSDRLAWGAVHMNLDIAVAEVLGAAMEYTILGLLEGRLLLTEAGFGANLGSHRIRRLRHIYLAAELGEGFLVAMPLLNVSLLQGVPDNPYADWRHQIRNVVTSVCHAVVGYTCFRGYSTVLRSMRDVSLPKGSYARREKDWARRVMVTLRWTTTMQCVCASGLHVYLVVSSIETVDAAVGLCEIVGPVGHSLLIMLEMVFLFVLTGRLMPRRSREFVQQPSRSRVAGGHSRTEMWRATTRALASRSITVGELLDFFEGLGKADGPMPHYRPHDSTTNDVVRQAVIPLSHKPGEPSGSAYASAFCPREGRPMPQIMVTHTWTGLFLDLVAAAVGDALGEDEYGGTAALLASGGGTELRGILLQRGMFQRSLWICAFTVNQHACICGGFGEAPPRGTRHHGRWDRGRRDTVTGEVFPSCDCLHPKLWNESSPDECEMNKFDDMIELLSSEVPGFAQLVAVDRSYAVFTRAWCVAELHRAHTVGLPQRVCMEKNRVLDMDADDLGDYRKLSMLSVTECEASRPNDKAEILGRITDTQEFDAQLQEVIFGSRGLLRHEVEGFGVLEAAARTAFRLARSGISPTEATIACCQCEPLSHCEEGMLRLDSL